MYLFLSLRFSVRSICAISCRDHGGDRRLRHYLIIYLSSLKVISMGGPKRIVGSFVYSAFI